MTERRTRIDIFADLLEVLKRYSEGCGITRLSYGAGMPNDRTKTYLKKLIKAGFVKPKVEDPKKYVITQQGIEFLDAYHKLKSFLALLKEV